jgi:hypothetical protein
MWRESTSLEAPLMVLLRKSKVVFYLPPLEASVTTITVAPAPPVALRDEFIPIIEMIAAVMSSVFLVLIIIFLCFYLFFTTLTTYKL